MKKLILPLLTAAFLALSCASLPSFRPVWNMNDVKSGETIVVGKIVFDPPLTENGRSIVALSSDMLSPDTVWMICGKSIRKIDPRYLGPDSDELKIKIDAKQGDTFYYAAPGSFYMIAAAFYRNIYRMSKGSRAADEFDAAVLPAGFYVDIQNGDKAVYVGTIKYTLDASLNVKKTEIIDEYDREMPMFRMMFGTLKLRKHFLKLHI
jgi:hypothetical protein